MKALLLALLVLVPLAHAENRTVETASAGPYTIQLRTEPAQLAPGESVLETTVSVDGEAAAGRELWLQLTSGRHVFFTTTTTTDQAGKATLTYRFDRPGGYVLHVEIDGNRAVLPVEVHGQYILLFGFLAAIFIVLALLLDRR